MAGKTFRKVETQMKKKTRRQCLNKTRRAVKKGGTMRLRKEFYSRKRVSGGLFGMFGSKPAAAPTSIVPSRPVGVDCSKSCDEIATNAMIRSESGECAYARTPNEKNNCKRQVGHRNKGACESIRSKQGCQA